MFVYELSGCEFESRREVLSSFSKSIHHTFDEYHHEKCLDPSYSRVRNKRHPLPVIKFHWEDKHKNILATKKKKNK